MKHHTPRAEKIIDAVFEPVEEKIEETHEFVVEAVTHAKQASKLGAKKLLSDTSKVASTFIGLATGNRQTYKEVIHDIARQLTRTR